MVAEIRKTTQKNRSAALLYVVWRDTVLIRASNRRSRGCGIDFRPLLGKLFTLQTCDICSVSYVVGCKCLKQLNHYLSAKYYNYSTLDPLSATGRFHFASAIVAVVHSQLTASSSASCCDCNPPSDVLNVHTRFMICGS